MSASSTKPAPGNPAWLDDVLGCLSPPFTFRNGGSAITGAADDRKPAQQSAAIQPAAKMADGPAKAKATQRG